jgi:hypothetical protein
MFRFVPVSGELVGHSDREFVSAKLDRLRWFEPGSKGVLRNFAPRAFEQTTPNFLRR